jgi:transcriptional regulator with GAF, ATPase, and Fis domain
MATPTPSAPYRLIYELGNAFASQLEVEPLLQLVTQKCREVLDAEGASILLLDASGNELYFPYLADLDPEVARRLAGLKFPATQGIAGEALSSGRALKVDDVSVEAHFYSLIDRHTGLRTRSLLAAPLLVNEQRLGALEVVNARGRACFSADDLVLLELLAHSIALALQHATRVDRLQATEQSLRTELGALRRDLAKQELFAEVVGASAEMTEVLQLITAISATPIAVLLEGETGTGKELLARALHRLSDRADRPFLAINCAALSEHLLESELFGHRRGAFTGAIGDRPGLFRAASGGVIFLDEIGEMPLAMQPKLLRVLQDGEIIPVGSARPERVDVRVISASNRDLRAAVAAGSFREDLYYRLAAFPIVLPPLRARRGDIALLAARFLATAAQRQHKPIGTLDPETLTLLERYPWPGNVRELQNEIERAVALTPPGEHLLPHRFSPKVRGATLAAPAASPPTATTAAPNGGLRSARADFEARYIGQVFAQHQRNVSQSARALGISRISLQRKLKDYQIR